MHFRCQKDLEESQISCRDLEETLAKKIDEITALNQENL